MANFSFNLASGTAIVAMTSARASITVGLRGAGAGARLATVYGRVMGRICLAGARILTAIRISPFDGVVSTGTEFLGHERWERRS
jgi:hypothetical protein